MAYVSLYRKYRPQTFEDVVGQDHITRTLKNAIREGRIASGYLFCGTRGTAKTTCARILAKALNCIGPDGTRTSPTPEPCGVCGPCRAIAASSFVDVIEMDAASHGKVDDVRDIVASIKFQPMEGRYKVYIVDESHQLSRDAMDAFLKTLEEPPDNVLFILATTDQDKMPITIQSRCQVFEFKRGSVAQIASRLTEVLAAEGVTADPAAITLVARAADGSYRDSLSLLEQVLAYKRVALTPADIAIVLGTVDEDVLAHVVDLIADSDAAGAFMLAGNILESGKDVRQFLKSLATRFRDMLFLGVGAEPQGAGEMDDSTTLRAQAARFAPSAMLQGLEVLTEAEREMRTNTQHRLLLEMSLLRLMRLPAAVAVGTQHAAPVHTVALLRTAAPLVPEPHPASPQSRGGAREETILVPALPLSEGGVGGGFSLLEDEDEEPTESRIITDAEELDIAPEIDDAEEAGEDLLFVQQAAMREVVPTSASNGHAPSSMPTHEEESLEDTTAEILDHLHRSWQEVINRVSSVRPAAVSLIKDAHAIALNGHMFTLELSNRFFVDRLSSNEAGRRMIEDQINKTLGVPEETYRVKGILRGEGLGPTRIAQSAAPRVRETPQNTPQATLDPLMDEVIAVFGGRIEEDDVKG
jgi:DNA polymerase-3 subunit gamma/tau